MSIQSVTMTALLTASPESKYGWYNSPVPSRWQHVSGVRQDQEALEESHPRLLPLLRAEYM